MTMSDVGYYSTPWPGPSCWTPGGRDGDILNWLYTIQSVWFTV